MKRKNYKWPYVMTIMFFVVGFLGMFFVLFYFLDVSLFGREIADFLSPYYVEVNEETIVVQYEGKNYYPQPMDVACITDVILKGGPPIRNRVYIKPSGLESKRELVIDYRTVEVTLWDLSTEKNDVTLIKYKIRNGKTKYYKVEGLNTFENVIKCIRLIKVA